MGFHPRTRWSVAAQRWTAAVVLCVWGCSAQGSETTDASGAGGTGPGAVGVAGSSTGAAGDAGAPGGNAPINSGTGGSGDAGASSSGAPGSAIAATSAGGGEAGNAGAGQGGDLGAGGSGAGGSGAGGSGAGGSGAGGSGAGGSGAGGSGAGGASTSAGPLTNRAASIPVGIENVNDSPLKQANYRALLRFVPDSKISIDRMYFGFKLRGAQCWDSGAAGYGAGDGGTLHTSLVNIDGATGLPTTEIASETVNGCERQDEAAAEVGQDPVMVWTNLDATLQQGTLYGLIVSNTHANPTTNFFSFNMPLADTQLAGPHARNELDKNASGGLMGLDPREHVAWSTDGGTTWDYGSLNGQYRSYMNDYDHNHPATRMPQYGFRLSTGQTVGVQPYYAYSTDCTSCSTTYANARYPRVFSELGGFTASGTNVGTLTIKNETTEEQSSCTPETGYGFRTCTLAQPLSVSVGDSYTVACTGSVEVMELDNPQRVMFSTVGTSDGELRMFQQTPAAGTNAKDVPNLWAGPLSAHFPAPGDP